MSFHVLVKPAMRILSFLHLLTVCGSTTTSKEVGWWERFYHCWLTRTFGHLITKVCAYYVFKNVISTRDLRDNTFEISFSVIVLLSWLFVFSFVCYAYWVCLICLLDCLILFDFSFACLFGFFCYLFVFYCFFICLLLFACFYLRTLFV